MNFDSVAELTGHPLEQYNAVKLDEEGMWRLCRSIALSATRNVAHVQQRFTQMWPSLSDQIKEAKKTTEEEQPPAPKVSEPQRIDALTASVRSLEATVKQLVGQNRQNVGVPQPAHLRTATAACDGGTVPSKQTQLRPRRCRRGQGRCGIYRHPLRVSRLSTSSPSRRGGPVIRP